MYTANRQAGDANTLDIFVVQARARAMRAEALADLIGRGLFATGRALRKAWYKLEQDRLDRALRRELARLDGHTLRDLGLSPASISSVTSDSLADHPLAVQARAVQARADAARTDRPANENAAHVTAAEIRTAA